MESNPNPRKRNKLGANSLVFPIKLLLETLCYQPSTAEELAEITGLRRMTIYDYLKIFHRGPNNLVYIVGYKRKLGSSGPMTNIWAFGYRQEDAPRPAVKKEKRKRYLQKRLSRDIVTPQPGVIRHVVR